MFDTPSSRSRLDANAFMLTAEATSSVDTVKELLRQCCRVGPEPEPPPVPGADRDVD